MIEVKSFTDRKGNKVNIGDTVGYFGLETTPRATGKVTRITKAGYFLEIYTESSKYPWHKTWIEKVEESSYRTVRTLNELARSGPRSTAIPSEA